ncbi:MAG: permease [Acidobacteriaceae bacterium]
MHWLNEIGRALQMAAMMGWQMLWALILGFGLSAVVQATVSRERVARMMPDGGPRSIAIASGLGAASSSCSYAAVAIARTLFRKGADFRAAMAFEFASTNLVFELGLSLIVLVGWRFAAAEFIGGPIMIVLLIILLNFFFSKQLMDAARQQADRGLLGRMEGHAAMDMAARGDTWLARLRSPQTFGAISNIYVMEWAAVLGDIVLGLVLSGCIAAWVPAAFWQRFFLVGHPALARWWGPLAGPLVALVSFVCSVGNVPLAAVLWQHGLSFGGVIAFLFGDLIILPIVNIHRKYYGWRAALVLLVLFYLAMAGAALAVEWIFLALHLTPHAHKAGMAMDMGFRWDHTAWLNLIFLAISAPLLWRFFRLGGAGMLRHMNEPMSHEDHGAHSMHHAAHDHGAMH